MRYVLLLTAILVETILFATFGIFGVVPSFTLLYLLLFMDSTTSYELVFATLLAGYLLDTLRSGYAPAWTVAYLLAMTIIWYGRVSDAHLLKSKRRMVYVQQVLVGSLIVGFITNFWHMSVDDIKSPHWLARLLLQVLIDGCLAYILWMSVYWRDEKRLS